MRRPLGKVRIVDPARADQPPIDMVLDHPLKRPGLRARLQAEGRVEVKAVFGFEMGANEGRIGDAFDLVDDIGQLPLGRSRRPRLLLAVGQAGHLELDLGLGHERTDFRQAEAGAEAIKRNHARVPRSREMMREPSAPLLPPWCQQREISGMKRALGPARRAAYRTSKASRACPETHVPETDTPATSARAPRRSPQHHMT